MRHTLLTLLTATLLLGAEAPASAGGVGGFFHRITNAFRGFFSGGTPALRKPDHRHWAKPLLRAGKGRRGEHATVLFLPGLGDNFRLPSLLAKALGELKVTNLTMVGRSIEPGTSGEQLEHQLRNLKDGRRVILAGHSMGGVAAERLAREYPEKVAAVLLYNPATVVSREMPVPTYVFRGTSDQRSWQDDYSRVTDKGLHNVEVIAVPGADHTNRYRPSGKGNKERAEVSADTAELNRAVARETMRVLEGLKADTTRVSIQPLRVLELGGKLAEKARKLAFPRGATGE